MAIPVASHTVVTTEEEYREHLKRLRAEIEKKRCKSVEQLYQERQKRLWDVIEMKEPDRVPVIVTGPYFAAKYCGLPYSSVYYDAIPWKAAYTKTMTDFEPDNCPALAGTSGAVLDILEAKNTRWPGGTLPPDVPHQSVEGEYMKEEEYDLFLEDTTDFTLRCFLPRVYGALAPLAKLPPPGDRGGGLSAITALFTNPEFQKVGQLLAMAEQAQKKWRQAMGRVDEDLTSLGFPPLSEGGGGGGLGPAFDHLANTYRGWKGIATDMYRRPDKLMAAMDKINRGQIKRLTPADPKKKGPKLGNGGRLHRGSDRFMSKQQWERFYWPTWKAYLQKLVSLGYVASISAQGYCENRLEYFLDFPKGSLFIKFTDTNMFKAKEVLGDRFCLQGSVPVTLLQMGSPSEVDEYCKKLIQVCGKGGGYILSPDTGNFIQDAKPENISVMVESARKYGTY